MLCGSVAISILLLTGHRRDIAAAFVLQWWNAKKEEDGGDDVSFEELELATGAWFLKTPIKELVDLEIS